VVRKVWIGYSDARKTEMENAIKSLL
jgi:hypothetical protein